ncbi:hypothetical protein F4802DRAFT_248941 [Xylaria palmicola]|nr:hypothetical protein F4802DRAFT_248941 [Xylaria palmicola]
MKCNSDERNAHSVNSSDSSPANTPTHSTKADIDSLPGYSSHTDHAAAGDTIAVPWHGQMYMIRHRSSGDVLTLINGGVELRNPSTTDGCWRWLCVEHRGWLGFRNVASRKYLGRDNKGGYCARAGEMRMWESFTLRPHPKGGCQLLATGWWDLKRAAVAGGGRTLAEVESAEEGALWDFIEALGEGRSCAMLGGS